MPAKVDKLSSNSKKVIVFGGSGFVGSHIADALSEAGYQVAIYDLKPSPYLLDGQKMIVGDILDREQVSKAIEGYDYVYNFAGFADLDDATTKPLDTAQQNIIGNLHIMDAALKAHIQRFIYASTIYVYSEKGGFYRCSKQSSELYVEEYNRLYGLNYTILRYSTLYGSRADKRNSIYRYLKQALDSNCINCPGTGEEVRDYIHVKDAALLSCQALSDQFKNKPITISGHHPVKFNDMVTMIKEIVGKDLKINYANSKNLAHYTYTPYSFSPKISYKLTNNLYIDMGQGLLECLHEINADSGKSDNSRAGEIREVNVKSV
jgi:UDP-glucose 4-epimerase